MDVQSGITYNSEICCGQVSVLPSVLSLFLSVTLGRLPCRHWARPFSPFLLLSNLKRGGDLEKMSSNYIHKVKHFFEPQSYNKHASPDPRLDLMSWMCLWPISRNALPSIKERAEKGGKERDNRNEDRHFLLLPLPPPFTLLLFPTGWYGVARPRLPPSAGVASRADVGHSQLQKRPREQKGPWLHRAAGRSRSSFRR